MSIRWTGARVISGGAVYCHYMATTTVPTNQAILDQLKIAMFNIVSGEHAQYTVNGRTFTKHDIDKLTNAISFYENEVAKASRGSVFGVGAFGGPVG